ncbi:MAG: carbonate dehydratase [Magnetococcales bacterium]|nr:carbonate dehydratase [Magnetococcales bacterium]
MDTTLEELFKKNRVWAENLTRHNPDFFTQLSLQQSPQMLWIGCSDSRVPANEIISKMPGEVFVHRNVANVVIHTDLNCLSVLQYAIEVLNIKQIIVCGHYGCGGVKAAMEDKEYGLIDNWLRNIRDISYKYRRQIAEKSSRQAQVDLVCELNVKEQVANVCHTTIVQNRWKQGHELSVHGIIYSIADGLLQDLHVSAHGLDDIHDSYRVSRPFVNRKERTL